MSCKKVRSFFVGMTVKAVSTILDILDIVSNILDPINNVSSNFVDTLNATFGCLSDPLGDIILNIFDPSSEILGYPISEVSVHEMLVPIADVCKCVSDNTFDVVLNSSDIVIEILYSICSPAVDILNDIQGQVLGCVDGSRDVPAPPVPCTSCQSRE